MTADWSRLETTTHQDHVIAHVIGASVLGYFVHDEAVHLLLDIGFFWTVYLDGQMVLLPQGVAISELDADAEYKAEVDQDVEKLQRADCAADALRRLSPVPAACVITDVALFASGDRRWLMITGEQANMAIETSLSTAQIEVSAG